jgi:site-specific recombinase
MRGMSEFSAQQINETVERHFAKVGAGKARAAFLGSALAELFGAATLPAALEAFSRLKHWSDEEFPSRLENLLELMEAEPALRAAFQRAVRRIVCEVHSVELFGEAGLHPREGLWSEAWRRVMERVLPSAREDTDLAKLVSRLYPTHKEIERLLAQPDDKFERVVRLLAPTDDPAAWLKQRQDLIQAFRLLGVHVAGLGLSPELRARSHDVLIEHSPFYRLQQSSGELVEAKGEATELAHWRAEAQRCREELGYVHERMEDTGVSTALVFDMGKIERAITRMESFAEVLYVAEPHESIAAVKRLLDDVMNARRDDLSLLALFRENSELLARKVVERTGKTGEHYIANSRSEYREIWKASLGGGLLTVLTAAMKMRIVEAHLAPFPEAMAAGTNYAVSFIVLQHLHLALATKQPSVTAATFAGIVRGTRGKARLEKVAEFISRITRSQLASAAGNLLAVGVGCVLFEFLWLWLFSRPYLDVHSAEHVYQTLDPLTSGTMIFAILTGVILWVSALAGGWFENFAIYNRIPEAIAQHPLGRRIGTERAQRFAEFVDRNLSGWATCIVLGYLLGFTPAVGRFLGIPLDVRHVTLSTGTLALAAASFGRDWLYRGWFTYTILGIAVTFVLNLGVSFSIAASVAMQAYGVSRREQLRVMRYTLWSFLRSPRRFLLPPKLALTLEPTNESVGREKKEEITR